MSINNKYIIYEGDALKILKKIESGTIDMIYADPPYFLSNNGITCSGGKMVSVNKGEWDKAKSFNDVHKFNKMWLAECERILKNDGSIFISGSFHNIFSIGMALQEKKFVILNNIVWEKTNPPPNLSCRYFTHSHESVIWAKKNKKSKHTFNYEIMKELNNNKQAKDVIKGPCITKKEKEFGKHPTQKPLYLIEKIIRAASNEGDLILDPFLGSGTTMVAASRLNRGCIGIELKEEYCEIAINRMNKEGIICKVQKIIKK